MLLLVVTHMAYLFEIGGDHFEYRPLDFYWPLLAVPTAEAVARLGGGLSAVLKRASRRLRWIGGRALAVVVFVPLLFYASAIQGVLLVEGMAMVEPDGGGVDRQVVLTDQDHSWLFAAPGLPQLTAVSNDLRSQSARGYVGLRAHTFAADSNGLIQGYGPYEAVASHVVPGDAVTFRLTLGIASYYVPNLPVVDGLGLTDATVARNPVLRTISHRVIAHDRGVPRGYLQRRGVNFNLYPAASTQAEALARASYALNVGPGIWMPFDVFDHAWANERFADHDVRAINRYSQTDPAGNRFTKDGVRYVGEAVSGAL